MDGLHLFEREPVLIAPIRKLSEGDEVGATRVPEKFPEPFPGLLCSEKNGRKVLSRGSHRGKLPAGDRDQTIRIVVGLRHEIDIR
jgi:hypothetical protein